MKLKITIKAFQDGDYTITSHLENEEYELFDSDEVKEPMVRQIQKYAELREIIRNDTKDYFSRISNA